MRANVWCLGVCGLVAIASPACKDDTPNPIRPILRATNAPAEVAYVPPGKGWLEYSTRPICARYCPGLPGAMMVDGRAPEPVCTTHTTAFCVTFDAQPSGPVIDHNTLCGCTLAACEAERKSLLEETRNVSRVSNCTELP